ncbi:MAG: hypothetical protein WDZ93_00385 [Candidatus Paceibacterota bacterium]
MSTQTLAANSNNQSDAVATSDAVLNQNLSFLAQAARGEIQPFISASDDFLKLLMERYKGDVRNFFQDVYTAMLDGGQPWAFEIEGPDGIRVEGAVHAGTFAGNDLESVDNIAIILDS